MMEYNNSFCCYCCGKELRPEDDAVYVFIKSSDVRPICLCKECDRITKSIQSHFEKYEKENENAED